MAESLVILRGLPGTGKTTWAARQPGAAVVSLDNIVPDDRRGMKPRDWWRAKDQCVREVEELVRARHPLVIVDNCHIDHASYQPYLRHAVRAGYETEVRAMHGDPAELDLEELAARNVHGVSMRVLRDYARRWEP